MYSHVAMAYQVEFWCFCPAGLHSFPLTPPSFSQHSVYFSPPTCILRTVPRKFLYQPMVFTVFRGESHHIEACKVRKKTDTSCWKEKVEFRVKTLARIQKVVIAEVTLKLMSEADFISISCFKGRSTRWQRVLAEARLSCVWLWWSIDLCLFWLSWLLLMT